MSLAVKARQFGHSELFRYLLTREMRVIIAFEKSIKLYESGLECDALDVLFNVFDDAMLAGKWDEINNALDDFLIHVDRLPLDCLISILTLFHIEQAQPRIDSYRRWFEITCDRIIVEDEGTPEEILDGLEPREDWG